MWRKERFFSSVPVSDGVTSWFWIAEPLFLALFCFASSVGIRQKILQYACLIAASFFLAFVTAEMYLRATNSEVDFMSLFRSRDSVYVKSEQTTHLYELSHVAPDPVLGYGPNLDASSVASRRVKDGKVLYDVLYTRDAEGRRITPDRGDKADTAILFFGCSFTVGEGVHDRETFAWRLGEMLGDKFQVFNYGYHGYGSHQMLALIESGRLDAIARRYTQIYAFYLTIADHETRCIGLWPNNGTGPRYILENGILKHAGRLNENRERAKFFSSSFVYRQVTRAYYLHLAPYSALDTHAAIIAQSAHELDARYHAQFLAVIYPDFTRIEPMLRARGVHTLSLTGVMPDYLPDGKYRYRIKGDGHPNALTHTLIAGALAEYMLKNARATREQQ